MNPNEYITKLIKIIQSCETIDHLLTSEKCVNLFDSREDLHYSFFDKNKDIFPDAHHMGDYDHLIAMYALKKELRNKEEELTLLEADKLNIQNDVIKLANKMRQINIHLDTISSYKFAIEHIKKS